MFRNKLPGKAVIISGLFVVLAAAAIFFYRHYRNKIACTQLAHILTDNTDSLYYLSYDYLHFDELSGNAQLRNVRVVPDTSRARNMQTEELPSALLDVAVNSITIKGVKTIQALKGKDISGDTIIIEHPVVTMYVLKPLKKSTLLESEVQQVYREILGKMNSVRFGFVLIDSIQVNSINFRTGKKDFDFLNGKIQLTDVQIDSIHNDDSSRLFFSRQAEFTVDSFYSYSNNRPELIVKKVSFSGGLRSITLEKIILNRFNDAGSPGKILLDASGLQLSGINTNAIVRRKDVVVDSVRCAEIKIYEPPRENLPEINMGTGGIPDTTSGFQNAYSIALGYLAFNNVNFFPREEKKLDIGKVRFQLHGVSAPRFADLNANPMNFIHELNLEIGYIKVASKDRMYNFGLQNISVNSLQKSLKIGAVYSKPALSEAAYADRYEYQKDRFDVSMKGISLDKIEMNNLFNNKLIASSLSVRQISLKIYRDLNKPLERKSRIGNYPSQMLEQLSFPVSIRSARLPSVNIEYREKQVNSGKIGVVNFDNTSMNISNITNVKNDIKKDNVLNVAFDTKVLNTIPVKGNFKFFLGKKDGDFMVNGTIGGFDASALNQIAVPMALVRIKSGRIKSIDFDLKGNDLKAWGPVTMKYENLKIDVLKKNEESKDLQKRGFLSFLANMVLVNDNPRNGKLRTVESEHDRNPQKSFFNLVWKTLLSGMKGTVAPITGTDNQT